MFFRIWLCGVIATMFMASGLATAKEPVTLVQFLETALASHLEVISHEFSVREAEARLVAAKSRPELELNIDLGYYHVQPWQSVLDSRAARIGIEGCSRFGAAYRLDADLKGKTVQFQLALPLFKPASLLPHYQEIKSCEHSYAGAKIVHQMIKEEVVLAAVQCFLNIWRLQEAVKIYQAVIDWLGSHQGIMAAAHRAGAVHELDLAFAQLQYEQQINAMEKLLGQLEAEKMLAVKVFGIPPGAEFVHDPTLFDPGILEAVLDWQQAPTITLAELNYDLAMTQMQAAEAAFGVQGELKLGVHSDRTWSVECSIRVPMFDQVYRSNQIAAANAKLTEAEFEVERAKSEIECEHIYRQVQLHAVKSNLKTAIITRDLAFRQKEIAEEQYAMGLLSLLEFLKVCEQEANAYLELVDAQYEYQLAQVQLRLSGRSQNSDG